MGQLYIYTGIGLVTLGLILLIADAATYRIRQTKKLAEIEKDYYQEITRAL